MAEGLCISYMLWQNKSPDVTASNDKSFLYLAVSEFLEPGDGFAGWFWFRVSPEVADKTSVGAAHLKVTGAGGTDLSSEHSQGCRNKDSIPHWLLAGGSSRGPFS